MERHEFLKEKYGLHKSEEVESAAKRTRIRTGEKVPQDPHARIGNYLDRLREVIDRKDPEKRERGMDAIKHILYDKYVIKPGDVPEEYFEAQRRMAREQGHGDIEISDELRRQSTQVIISHQQSSLDTWVDYLSSPDATYPDWLKYWTIRSVLGMGEYDKEKKAFGKRSKGTVKPFPDINREALAYVLDAVSHKYGRRHIDLLALEEEEKKELEKLLEGENFSKLYAWALEKTVVSPTEELENTAGKWIKYNQNSDHMPLVQSLQGHGTGWCTAGESTAQIQLKGGDFYVYYSLDKKGKPTIPRAAIRMEEDSIAEVRGIASEQNLDSYIAPVVETKLKEFPDGASYEKKARDMKLLTAIEEKSKAGTSLTKEDLLFLYEVNNPIEGFGYDRDPRIADIRGTRRLKEDLPILFGVPEKEITFGDSPEGITEHTKVYIGPLFLGIFEKIQKYNIEYVYTSFPEGRIIIESLEIGGKSSKELIQELKSAKIKFSDYAEDMMKSKDFEVLEDKEEITLVRLKVRDLFGERAYPTTNELYKKAEELGLELCKPEVGPALRLNYQNQPLNEWFYIGMKPITDLGGRPRAFKLVRNDDGLWLSDYWAFPERGWDSEHVFVFSLRPEGAGKLRNSET